MAGKNEVTLTFAGDADKLEKSIRQVTGGTGDLEKAFDRVGTAAKGMDKSLGGVGGSSDRLRRSLGDGGKGARDFGAGFDTAGGHAEEFEDRMMGLGGGIASVNDLMHASEQDAAGIAMAFSDLGMAARYTLLPSIKDVIGQFGKLPTSAKLAAGALAGVTVAATGLWLFASRRAGEVTKAIDGMLGDVDVSDMESVTSALDTVREKMRTVRAEAEGDSKLLPTIPNPFGEDITFWSTDDAADRAEMLEQLTSKSAELRDAEAALKAEAQASAAEWAGATTEMLNHNSAVVDNINSLRELDDALRAQFDPVFGMVDALQSNADANRAVADAQAAVNEAIATYGISSPEALTAQQALTEAQRQAAGSALDVDSAMTELNAAIMANPALLGQSKAQLDVWVAQGLITRDTADAMKRKFDEAASSAGELGASDPNVNVTSTGLDALYANVENVKANISSIPRDIVVNIRAEADANRFAATRSLYATGGVVYAAGGHPGMPRGTDTVPAWLTPGEMVLNKGQQANLFDAIDSGRLGGSAQQSVVNVNVSVAGSIRSDRDLVKVIRDELARGGMRGVLR